MTRFCALLPSGCGRITSALIRMGMDEVEVALAGFRIRLSVAQIPNEVWSVSALDRTVVVAVYGVPSAG